ncbi:branched-chain amino acid ABC transporter ATP-binding protein/permease [Rhodococcus sp. T7]|uniref:branched-chain amino acid ABC transporter ATP-binding protein/permease n=1 Tax=Rhodococcus sp. T7 TaxID=627444 RepID=UPI00135766BF|nr:ATP-binding cassette domain-containing protein [Rhodococcus sp. T7]KAF0957812.1 Vitamin B12 import ATP-binding protein BtuD [Rhodococcus sp. T7]KAF0961535.1 Vitamin B12 import ATP-binding protein BtuD [Rhodococcus sp. T7]
MSTLTAPNPTSAGQEPTGGRRSLLSRIITARDHRGVRLPSRRNDATQILVLAIVVAAFLAFSVGARGGSQVQLGIDIAMFVALAYSWNIISGFTGYISFGQVVFFGFGALFTAELIIHADTPWYLAAVLGGVASAIIAIPVGMIMLRLRGIYFALGMFGLAYIVSLLCSQWSYTGGSTGLVVPGALAQTEVLLAVTGVAVLAFAANAFMARSHFGLRAMAIRDDEEVAAAVGVRTTQVKVIAFALSAVMPAIVGGFIAYNRAFIDSSTVFDPTLDLMVIVFVLAGGIGTVWGPLIGASVLTIANEQLSTRLPDYQLALFGVLVILITIFLPGGIVSLFNKIGWLRREIVKGPHSLRDRSDLEASLEHVRDVPMNGAQTGELLSCRDVGVKFGGVHALRGVDFDVPRGRAVFIIGANGAGKTTLFNAIAGVVRPSSGTITFDGIPIRKLSAQSLARRGMARTYQIPRPFESLTVWENILIAALGGRRRHQAVGQTQWVVRVLGLEDICFSASDTLPIGHRRMVELGRALALQPKLILLDEVMAGMSEDELERVREAIRSMPSFGVEAIAGIEHVIKAIVDLTDEIVVLDQGARIISGAPAEILRHPEVIRAYLGISIETETQA